MGRARDAAAANQRHGRPAIPLLGCPSINVQSWKRPRWPASWRPVGRCLTWLYEREGGKVQRANSYPVRIAGGPLHLSARSRSVGLIARKYRTRLEQQNAQPKKPGMGTKPERSRCVKCRSTENRPTLRAATFNGEGKTMQRQHAAGCGGAGPMCTRKDPKQSQSDRASVVGDHERCVGQRQRRLALLQLGAIAKPSTKVRSHTRSVKYQ